MSVDGKNKRAVVIPLRRGQGGVSGRFGNLPFEAKLACIRELSAREGIELICVDPEGRKLARSLHPQELYYMLKETGEADALPLIEFSSPEQCCFFLDMELWNKWDLSSEKAMEWLSYLLKTGEERVVEQLSHIDFELLLLICKREIFVGGGLGDQLSDEERSAEWDHTFDNTFFITFRDPENGQLMGRFLDIVFRNDQELYLMLMEGVKYEVESELEDLAFRFRTGRLSDLGFPELEDSLSIYSCEDPEQFVPAGDKISFNLDEDANYPVRLPAGDSLFRRAMALAGSEELYVELNYLINAALVAEQASYADNESVETVVRRVCGYLNIALERIAPGDDESAARILNGEYLRRLFQLGYGIISGLRKRALALTHETSNHATNRALLGFRRKIPQFYRGLDPDLVDGYREFADMVDVQAVDLFLRRLEDI